ncbi:UTP--glucose-1-phosphate uridylyltransferase GalU [uncultured Ilyobacter sp.]|uniref:UTP--glucose-1-phosphate uridylyltransferase GalU n=1 Tax=uncultured Ilyobacter sp. TaxID=544433 RepID=UPI0029BFF16D|nr:UTP--glucose-1-phosphate uridylyltransferase GalU [uncultured Ilyobacter sp.]
MILKIRKAVIPAAGLGTRVLPATKAQPKEMLTVVDKPSIQYIVEELVKSGIDDITIITGRNKYSLEDHFDYSYELEDTLGKKGKEDMLKMVREISELANIYFIRQKEPLGLGHAILAAKHHIGDEPFAVVLGDDIIHSEKPVIKQMIEIREKFQGGSIIGVQEVAEKDVSKYGIAAPGETLDDKTVTMKDFIEKPSIEESPSRLACLGRYILEPQIFDYLENGKPGKGGEIQLTDSILEMIKSGDKVLAYDFEGQRYDIGNKFGLLKANIEFGMRHPEIREELEEYLENLAKK